MKSTFAVSAAAIALLIGLSAPAARAGYIVVLTHQVGDIGLPQPGNEVVATGSGAIDLTGLHFLDSSRSGFSIISPVVGEIVTAQAFAEQPLDTYTGFTGPTSFGSGPGAFAESGGGDIV